MCVCFRANQAETQVESVDVVQEDVVEDGDEDWVSEKKGRSP